MLSRYILDWKGNVKKGIPFYIDERKTDPDIQSNFVLEKLQNFARKNWNRFANFLCKQENINKRKGQRVVIFLSQKKWN